MIISFLLYLLLPSLFSTLSISQPLRGRLIDCGATFDTDFNGLKWLSDKDFITTGLPRNLSIQYQDATLSTVRTFPYENNLHKKFCYVVPVYRTGKYLVRTTYFYGGVNENVNPPVFDQIVDGTFWVMVNTTNDYLRNLTSYYEGVFMATGKSMSVCLAANQYTDSDPFMSALELVLLDNSLYNSTDFTSFGLSLISRNSFGYNGSIIRYPDDVFDRYWEPYGDINSTASRIRDVEVSGFWNIPPLKVFQTQLSVNQPEQLEILWPSEPIPNSTYYIALYFADDPGSSRVFSVYINGVQYYNDLNMTSDGVSIIAKQWPLAGLTNITLSPAAGSRIGPLINAGEIFGILPLGGRTLTRDVIALEKLKESFVYPPVDWTGDPCLPRGYSWTGVSCSEGPRIRVTNLNLTGMGLSGSISPSIADLTGLSEIYLANNNLEGSIPDFSTLKLLEILHLEDNQITGEIPSSLGNMEKLRGVFLQNNNLTGQVPGNLIGKPGLDFRYSPGNPSLSIPQS
ncbi:hypothetical protein LIER_27302 [Lithospermum erythrorhizon]|uniref:Uncharacterized protein n=1 Tax=Lithospermum erythrorhizon TaxID=34254 RepID=A0AAV3RF44_LITER